MFTGPLPLLSFLVIHVLLILLYTTTNRFGSFPPGLGVYSIGLVMTFSFIVTNTKIVLNFISMTIGGKRENEVNSLISRLDIEHTLIYREATANAVKNRDANVELIFE